MTEVRRDSQDTEVSFYTETYPNQQLLVQHLERWFVRYSPEIASLQIALYKSQLNSMSAQRAFAEKIKPLKSAHDFAWPLLNQKMLEVFGLNVDCRYIYLEEVTATQPHTVVSEQPIICAALRNFDAGQKFHSGSAFYYKTTPYPPDSDGVAGGSLHDVCGSQIACSNGFINVTPDAFAQMCRSLDLGGKYEAHLEAVLGTQETLNTAIGDAFALKERARFKVLTHMARMNNQISQEVYRGMLEVAAKSDGSPRWRYSIVSLFAAKGDDTCWLYGVLMIESYRAQASASPDDGPVVVYMPGEPNHPLKEYARVSEFVDYLRVQLDDPAYVSYFTRFLPIATHATFRAKLQQVLRPKDVFDARAQLPLHRAAVEYDPFLGLYFQVYSKFTIDARLLAVPVKNRKSQPDSTPAQTLTERFRQLAHFGFDLADAFLPVSELRDLVKDVFVAIEDWSDGEREKALSQLYSIGKDLVLAAAPKAGKKLEMLEQVYADGKQAIELILAATRGDAGQGGSTLDDEISELPQGDLSQGQSVARPSGFIEGLTQVRSADGRTRLWKPDLHPFESQQALPKEAVLDHRSLFRTGDKTWLSMEGRHYRIGFDSGLKKWRVLRPDGRQQYAPVLETNGVGAWRFEGENPMGWDAYKAFRRLHGDNAALDDATINRILRITETDEALLRQIHVDKLVPPALLMDCTERFLIDRQVSGFIKFMNSLSGDEAGSGTTAGAEQTFATPDIEPYLDFIVMLPGWPESRLLRRVDAQGNPLTHHRPVATASRNVDVVYTPGKMQALLSDVLAGLSPVEVESLLVNYQPPQSPAQYLALRLAAEAQGRRKALLDCIYAVRDRSVNALIRLLRRDFPSLPYYVAKEIIDFADQTEISRMKTARRIPLRLAEQAREYLQQVRLNRTLECFYLHLDSPDKDIVSLNLISSLSQWPPDLVLEVRRSTFDGETLFHSGARPDVPVAASLVLVQTGDRYQAFNHDGQSAQLDARSLATSLSSALDQQAQLSRDVRELELALGDLATAQRPRVKRTLGLGEIKPGIKWPSRLPDGRLGYPLSGRMRRLFGIFRNNASAFSPELAVKRLYPQFTAQEIRDFLDQMIATFPGTPEEKKNLTRARLNELAQEYGNLESTLDGWLADSERSVGATAEGRSVARMRILSCWRKEPSTLIDADSPDSAHLLNLDNLSVGALPAIVANFDHVQALTLENIGLTGDEAGNFVKRFPQLRLLSLNRNLIATVPDTLGDLALLTKLVLSYNPILLNTQGLQQLQRLAALRTLQIEGPDISFEQVMDVRHWPALVELKLRGCGLATMPAGLGQHEPLRHVDLRHNQITEIDEPVLRGIASRIRLYVRLHQNPLSAETIDRALNILDEATLVRMGIRDMLEQTLPQETTAQWLYQTGSLEQRQHWADMQLESNGEAFTQLINDLFWTADYRDNRSLLAVRVWRMIDAMAGSDALREELFTLAAHPETCGDGTMLIFNSLDVRVLVDRLKTSSEGITPVNMFKLMRSLERLGELERIALEDFSARVVAHPGLDQVEVRLVYPTRLQSALDLPGQSQDMLFENLAGVDQDMLERARQRVLAWENKPEFLEAMVAREDWLTFLEEHFRRRFNVVNQPFHDRQDELDAQQHVLTDSAYKTGSDEVAIQRRIAVQALALELTQDVAVVASESA